MGCSCSRQNVFNEESAIIAGEKTLGYYLHDVAEVFQFLESLKIGETITSVNMERFAERFKLNLGLCPPCSKIKSLYDSFKISENDYNFRLIGALVVLLCNGSPENKASNMFRAFNTRHERNLSKDEISHIIDQIFVISLVKLPTLIVPVSHEYKYTEDSLNNYLNILYLGLDNCKKSLIYSIYTSNDVILEEMLKRYFYHIKRKSWLSSQGIRKRLFKRGQFGLEDRPQSKPKIK